MTPEENARQKIDTVLTASSLTVQTKDRIGVEEQSAKYIPDIPFIIAASKSPVPFCCESTDAETFFTC